MPDATLTEAVKKGFENLTTALLSRTAGGPTPGAPGKLSVYTDAISDPREEVLLCYTKGDLVFKDHDDGFGNKVRYGLLKMQLVDIGGGPGGEYLTVWQPDPSVTVADLLTQPAKPFTGPFDKPAPIPHFPMRANSMASYTFGTKGTLYATGPANLLLVPLKDGSHMFHVSVAAYVTGGTGEFADCSGVNTALGSSLVPAGADFLKVPEGQKIPGFTVSTFRIVKKADIK